MGLASFNRMRQQEAAKKAKPESKDTRVVKEEEKPSSKKK